MPRERKLCRRRVSGNRLQYQQWVRGGHSSGKKTVMTSPLGTSTLYFGFDNF
jgi:hypothetical protein